MKEFETISIRPVEARDYPDILRLNAANVSVLAPMDGQIIERFAEWAELFWVAEAKGEFAAFLIALREGVGNYWSENYKWFSARYTHSGRRCATRSAAPTATNCRSVCR